MRLLDPVDPASSVVVTNDLCDGREPCGPAVNGTRTGIAELAGRFHRVLEVGRLRLAAGAQQVTWRKVPGARRLDVLARADSQHVVVGDHPEALDGVDTLQSVDLRTGVATEAASLPPGFLTVGQVARDLWSEPTVPGVEPQQTSSPRQKVASQSVLGWLCLWPWWRRSSTGGDVSDRDEVRAQFEEFVAARRGALLRTAYLMVGNHHDAEDLVQLAPVKAFPHWGRIEHAPAVGTVNSQARDALARLRVLVPVDDADVPSTVAP